MVEKVDDSHVCSVLLEITKERSRKMKAPPRRHSFVCSLSNGRPSIIHHHRSSLEAFMLAVLLPSGCFGCHHSGIDLCEAKQHLTMANNDATTDPETVWIYHELQESLLCGQHAVNNLTQGPNFSAEALAQIAQQLDEMELAVFAQNNEGGRNSKDYLARLREGSQHVNESGYFSLECLLAAVQNKYGVALVHSSQSTQDFAAMQGFLCHKSDHWFAIRQVGGRFWNLNSMLERPQAISHFTLATDIEKWQNEGYTVYCVASGLPTGGFKVPGSSGNTKANWHRMSDLLKGKSTVSDPWENLNGKGMRLDGGATVPSTVSTAGTAAPMQVEGLSDDEMLQMALQASMEAQQPVKRVVTASSRRSSSRTGAGHAGRRPHPIQTARSTTGAALSRDGQCGSCVRLCGAAGGGKISGAPLRLSTPRSGVAASSNDRRGAAGQ